MSKKTTKAKFPVSKKKALDLLRQMILIRRFEEKCVELYSAEKIRGFMHLYIGEEANAVGVMQAMKPEDAIVATYREHGHALARGVSTRTVMAEMYGKAEGCSGGRGGSMHLFDAETRFFGGYAIVGGGLPIAAGLGLADRMRGTGAMTCCFFGEGAAAEGEFHETLNMAALWGLPVLFVCENNLYAMGTALERSESQPDMTQHATSYGLPVEAVDGMDVIAVMQASERAAKHIRAGKGPYFLECRTYRFRAHSMFDAELYRERSEVETWKKKGPILKFTDRLRKAKLLDDETLARIEAEIASEIEEAVAFSEAGSWEPVEELTRNVMTEPAGGA